MLSLARHGAEARVMGEMMVSCAFADKEREQNLPGYFIPSGEPWLLIWGPEWRAQRSVIEVLHVVEFTIS